MGVAATVVGVAVGVEVGVDVGVDVGVPVTAVPTVVCDVAVLFPVTGSNAFVLTVAVLVISPGVLGAVTWIVIAGAFPGASDVTVQLTTPEVWEQFHPVPDAETNDVPAGSVSVTVA